MDIISLDIKISESLAGFDLLLKFMILLDEIWLLRNDILNEGKVITNIQDFVITTRHKLYSKALSKGNDNENAQSTNSAERFQVSFTIGFFPYSKFYKFIDESFCYNVGFWTLLFMINLTKSQNPLLMYKEQNLRCFLLLCYGEWS